MQEFLSREKTMNKAIRPEQETLNKVKELCFNKAYPISEAEQLAHSKTFKYGFRYNAGQEPPLKNEYEDYEPLATLLTTAKNKDIETNETTFPDFVCQNGIIEHFKVFATKENKNKKGSELMKIRAKLNEEIEKDIERDEKNGTLKDFYYKEIKIPEQTYEMFVNSFITNWNNHKESLNNYKKEHNLNDKVVCFLIENVSFGLRMNIKQRKDYVLGIETGKLIENRENRNESFDRVMVGRCKELLQFIYENRDLVDYVICYSNDGCVEIIKAEQTKYIISLLPEYKFHNTITVINRTITAIGDMKYEN